ncbi:hypothetical protein HK405_008765, partial [Cladochytrium tenue]
TPQFFPPKQSAVRTSAFYASTNAASSHAQYLAPPLINPSTATATSSTSHSLIHPAIPFTSNDLRGGAYPTGASSPSLLSDAAASDYAYPRQVGAAAAGASPGISWKHSLPRLLGEPVLGATTPPGGRARGMTTVAGTQAAQMQSLEALHSYLSANLGGAQQPPPPQHQQVTSSGFRPPANAGGATLATHRAPSPLTARLAQNHNHLHPHANTHTNRPRFGSSSSDIGVSSTSLSSSPSSARALAAAAMALTSRTPDPTPISSSASTCSPTVDLALARARTAAAIAPSDTVLQALERRKRAQFEAQARGAAAAAPPQTLTRDAELERIRAATEARAGSHIRTPTTQQQPGVLSPPPDPSTFATPPTTNPVRESSLFLPGAAGINPLQLQTLQRALLGADRSLASAQLSQQNGPPTLMPQQQQHQQQQQQFQQLQQLQQLQYQQMLLRQHQLLQQQQQQQMAAAAAAAAPDALLPPRISSATSAAAGPSTVAVPSTTASRLSQHQLPVQLGGALDPRVAAVQRLQQQDQQQQQQPSHLCPPQRT